MRHLRTSPWSGQAAVKPASIAIASYLPLRGNVRWIAAGHAKDTLNKSIGKKVDEAMDGNFRLTRFSFFYSYLHKTCLDPQIERPRGVPSGLNVILALALSEISNEGLNPKNNASLGNSLGQ
jgi:hypothetical protein